MVQISVSLLSANFANLTEEIRKLEKAGADMLHLDIMDGHFVPNLSFGSFIVKTIRNITRLPLEVHLMINNIDLHIDSYIDSGADYIIIHPETTVHLDRSLQMVKNKGKKVGIALLPHMNIDLIDYVIDKIDLCLVMTVNPGFSGQNFLHNQLRKIEQLSNIFASAKKSIKIAVDGGINEETSILCRRAGANLLISGSFIFSNQDYKMNIEKLKSEKY